MGYFVIGLSFALFCVGGLEGIKALFGETTATVVAIALIAVVFRVIYRLNKRGEW